MMIWIKKNWLPLAISTTFFFAIGMPIHIYMRHFGDNISDSHVRWAEMGSAMSGIYGPILASLTFIVLVFQLVLQRQTTLLQITTTKHMLNQAYIQNSREDVSFYLTKLSESLDMANRSGITVREHLLSYFENASVVELLSPEVKQTADSIEKLYPQVHAAWSAIYCIYGAVADHPGREYQMLLVSSCQRTEAMIDHKTCVALDNYIYSLRQGKPAYPYQYSEQLRSI